MLHPVLAVIRADAAFGPAVTLTHDRPQTVADAVRAREAATGKKQADFTDQDYAAIQAQHFPHVPLALLKTSSGAKPSALPPKAVRMGTASAHDPKKGAGLPMYATRSSAAAMSPDQAMRSFRRALAGGPATLTAWFQSGEGPEALRSMMRSIKPEALVNQAEQTIGDLDKALRDNIARLGTGMSTGVRQARGQLASMLKGLNEFSKLPWQDKLKALLSFTTENIGTLTPIVGPVMLSLFMGKTGAALLPVAMAGIAFAATVKAIDFVLDDDDWGFMPNVARVVSAGQQSLAEGFGTNGGELASSMGSTIQPGSSVLDGASGSLMSNFWNTGFLFVAYMAALPKLIGKQLEAKGIEGGKMPKLPELLDAVKGALQESNWRAIGEQFMYASGFALDSLAFIGAAATGNPLMVGAWLLANFAAVFGFLKSNVIAPDAVTQATVGRIEDDGMEAFQTFLEQHPTEALQTFMDKLEIYRERLRTGGGEAEAMADLQENLTSVKDALETHPELLQAVNALRTDADAELVKPILDLIRALGVEGVERVPLDKQALTRATLAVVGFTALSAFALGPSAAALGSAMGLPLWFVNSVFVAAASSLPEFGLMKQYFEEGMDREAGMMASVSNMANGGIGGISVILHAMMSATGAK